ncbi:MAG: trans-sulfuration enzyme family protein [Saprospiraceae bacterium]
MKLPTTLIHEGKTEESNNAIMSPIVLSTTFERGDDGLSFPSGYMYSRYDNPNRHRLEVLLAAAEAGEACLSFSSGLAAALAVFQSLRSGDHIVLPDDSYFGVRNILEKLFPQFGLTYSLCNMSDISNIEAVIQSNTRLLWIETPSNPGIKISDIRKIVDLARKHNCFTVADNTWATPYFTQPLLLGVDIVLQSSTKYLGGHSDLLSGALIFKEKNERFEFISTFQKAGGAVPSPFDCWLLCRSLATFTARMPIHAKNAMHLSEFLEKKPQLEQVLYPGLASFSQHELARAQMTGGFGGMLSILVKGGREKALLLCGNLKIIRHATSLGGVESLIEHRKSSEGEFSQSPDNLLRISVGIEAVEDLIADLEQALDTL